MGTEMYCLLGVTLQQTQFLTPDITQKSRKPMYCKPVSNMGVASDNILLQDDRSLILKTAIYNTCLC